MAELDTGRIAAAALALVDEHGLKGFSMRGVARALNVTPMALYHHVSNKAELAELVVSAANAEQPLAPPTGEWREDMWQMCRASRQSMLAHPRVAELRRAYRVWTPDVLEKTEYWVSLWQQSGLTRDDAVLAAATASIAILGLVEDESLRSAKPPLAPDLDSSKSNAAALLNFQFDRETMFELAVRSLIDGLHQRLMDSGNRP